ncbi:hypothetical protein FLP41_18190 [Paracoccus marcusii]|uniref:hypothetical protein n=1 Tax=Paracoccus marcusii TaxID=59779 RepID=UPI002ED688BB|nr:hypothetical protein FLP41_18190 [Paracoccus marcusii]
MRKMLGATEAEMMSLEHADILIPSTALKTARLRWDPKDAEALIDELNSHASRSDSWWCGGLGLHPDRSSPNRRERRRIFTGLRAGHLRLKQQSPKAGYHGYQVSIADVIAMDESSSVETGRAASLSEFERGIGMRDAAQLLTLVESGDLAAESIIHPVTRRRMWTVSESAVAAFRAHFLNLTMIEQEFGLQRNVSRSILNGAAIRPYLTGKGNVGTLNLRIGVEEALCAAGHENG